MKSYNIPKKNGQKRKKLKLTVLKYYKVEGNGAMSHLRWECPPCPSDERVCTKTCTAI